MANVAEKKHMDAVAQLGCIVCTSPATIHHCGTYMGGGRDHMKVLPLCPEHHQGKEGIDGKHMSKRQWEAKYGTEEHLLAVVAEKLAHQRENSRLVGRRP
jgi:hypothetical protein